MCINIHDLYLAAGTTGHCKCQQTKLACPWFFWDWSKLFWGHLRYQLLLATSSLHRLCCFLNFLQLLHLLANHASDVYIRSHIFILNLRGGIWRPTLTPSVFVYVRMNPLAQPLPYMKMSPESELIIKIYIAYFWRMKC